MPNSEISTAEPAGRRAKARQCAWFASPPQSCSATISSAAGYSRVSTTFPSLKKNKR